MGVSLLLLMISGLRAAPLEEIRVGQTRRPESRLLGALAAGVLAQEPGSKVARRSFDSERELWLALRRGEIDVYATSFAELDRMAPGPRTRRREAVSRMGLYLSWPLGFAAGTELAMSRELAGDLGVRRLSDLKRHPELGWTLLESGEIGKSWARLSRAYRLRFADGPDLIEVERTDPGVERRDLLRLEDDLGVLPDTQAVFLARGELSVRSPWAIERLESLEGRISREQMSWMRSRLRGSGNDVLAAAEFLRIELWIEPPRIEETGDSPPATLAWAGAAGFALCGILFWAWAGRNLAVLRKDLHGKSKAPLRSGPSDLDHARC